MADETKQSLREEREALELEQLRDEVHRRRAQKEVRTASVAENEKSFREGARQARELAARCNHKKGGRDFASLQKRGDGDNYAFFPFQHPLGYMLYLCSHCLFLWTPGVTEKFMADGVTPNPTGISWEQASRLPTDNSPAGSVLFGPRIVTMPSHNEAA